MIINDLQDFYDPDIATNLLENQPVRMNQIHSILSFSILSQTMASSYA